MEQEPTYRLEGVIRSKEEMEDFEGPLNLILMLLSKNKIEIRDIQVSLILEQYTAYLEEMKAMDMEVASEFVQMAAHLLYIKTKMLLQPDEEELGELDLLIASLEQLKARDVYAGIKELVPDFQKAAEHGMLYHTKAPEPLKGVKEYRYQHEGWELLKAIADVSTRVRSAQEEAEDQSQRRRRLFPKRIIYSVRDKSREIIRKLSYLGKLSLREFYKSSRSRSELVATFISVLELCKSGHAGVEKHGDDYIVNYIGGAGEEELFAESSE